MSLIYIQVHVRVFLCIVYPMFPGSLDCPFLITHSVFSNVYQIEITKG